MTPTMYGYARLPGVETAELVAVRRKLSEFARDQGFQLAEFFVVRRPGERLGVWRELLGRCAAAKVRSIVVPSLSHLHPTKELADAIRAELAQQIGGRVWVLDEQGEADAEPPGQEGAVSG